MNNVINEEEQESSDVIDVKNELPEMESEYKDKWIRAQADYQNLQKEMVAERQAWAKMSEIYVLEEFIPILENFKKAFSYDECEDKKQFENWKKGISFIMKQFEDVLRAHQVTRIETIGRMFDPKVHEAVSEEENEEPEETIVREIEGGYMVGERVFRVAKVVLSKGKQT